MEHFVDPNLVGPPQTVADTKHVLGLVDSFMGVIEDLGRDGQTVTETITDLYTAAQVATRSECISIECVSV